MIRRWRTALAVAVIPLVVASCAVAARSGEVITDRERMLDIFQTPDPGRTASVAFFSCRWP